MQRTCAKCGFNNTTLPRAAVCPKCLTPYAAQAVRRDKAKAVPVPAAAATAPGGAERGWRIWRMMGLVLFGAIVFVSCSSWMKREQSHQQRQQAEGRQAELSREQDARAIVQKAIDEQRVFIGMSADDVRRAWGDPTSVNTTTTASGTREQWVYRWGNTKQQYVYLVGGKVSSIQSMGS